ncbi:hypothetical protein [Streptomyces sp. NPDC005281]|uniref:hypothetical protein n=1 Tax=Streptomyces sp. NPDC005281 TaxID=3155712 RepID=UPI0033B1AD44
MTAAPEPRVRLAQYIERRITTLALEYAEVCRRADISDETLGKIRKGMRARSSTYYKLERALEWVRGSVAAILDGGEPTAVEDGTLPGVPAAELAEELSLAQRLLASTIRELRLTPSEADEVWRRVRLELERSHGEESGQATQERQNPRAG